MTVTWHICFLFYNHAVKLTPQIKLKKNQLKIPKIYIIIGKVTMHHLLDRACELHHFQLTNSSAHKTYVKRRKQSSKGFCHLHLLCRRKRTWASGLLQRAGGKSAPMKAPKGKRLSQRLSVTRQKLAGFFHTGQPKNHRSGNSIQAVPWWDKGQASSHTRMAS